MGAVPVFPPVVLPRAPSRTRRPSRSIRQVSVGNVVVELIPLVAPTALPKAYGLDVGGDPGVIQPGNQPSVGQEGNPRG